MRLTQTQGKRLCELAHLFRPEWDIPGIAAAVRDASTKAAGVDVARALLAICADPAVKTPGMLPKPGRHWPTDDDGNSLLPVSHDVRCPEHTQHVHPCPQCVAKRSEPSAEYLEAKKALAQIAKPKAQEKRHQPTPAEELARARARADRQEKP